MVRVYEADTKSRSSVSAGVHVTVIGLAIEVVRRELKDKRVTARAEER
jgi:hypothetical protein